MFGLGRFPGFTLKSAFPFLHFRNSGIARVAFHQMGFTVAGTASDSITEFPFIQIEKKDLYHQIGSKGRQLFYICFKIRHKMAAKLQLHSKDIIHLINEIMH